MKKQFLELKQIRMTLFEYECEFVWLSKYAKDLVPDEEVLCIRFERGLNEELRVSLFALGIRDFISLSVKVERKETTIQERNKFWDREGASAKIRRGF